MRCQTLFSLSISLLLLAGCGGNKIENTTNTTKPEKTPQSTIDRVTSRIQKATDTAQSTIDKAKIATEQATQSAQTKINDAKTAVDKATESTKGAIQDVVTLKEGVQGMSLGVSNTLSSVKSGNIATAQQEFTKVQESWTNVEGTVKSKSAVTYEQINGRMIALNTLFEAKKPDAVKLTTELQALGQSLITAVRQK